QVAVAVLDNDLQADGAIAELRQKGFTQGQIHRSSRVEGAEEGPHYEGRPATSDAVQGAGLGELVGAAVGGLVRLGPGAVAGQRAGGLIGAFIGRGVPEEEAKFYRDQYDAGRVIVAVTATDGRYDEAAAILRGHGGRVDVSPLSEVGPGVLP